ncbi:MAG: hypothetical protein ACD_20C00123G0006 [uncultured bacterium]|nr:MAG: hypothetical protein ACD_20C00123G0006 [uncultured bacterium]
MKNKVQNPNMDNYNNIQDLAKVYIDKRPLALLFLLEYKNAILLIFAFLLFFIFISPVNLPQGLGVEAYQTMIIFIFAVFLWVTNIIPLAITSLMIMALLSTFNVLEASKIFSFFGNESLFFILGSFIISAGVSASGLSERISYHIISRFKETPEKLVLAIFFLSAFMSHIMTEHAVAAMLFPILISMSNKLRLGFDSVLGKHIFFAMAWGCSIGGVVTLLGGARNPLAIGILQESTGNSIGFLEWIIVVAPPAYILMAAVAFYIKRSLQNSTANLNFMEKSLSLQDQRVGKVSFKEIKALLIFLLTIYMWIFHSKEFGVANIALISAALFFVLNVMKWDDAKKEINWGTILMYGGAIAIGKCLAETGVLDFITGKYISDITFSLLNFVLIVSILSLLLTQVISNSAVVIILLPIILKVASQFGLSPELAVFLVAIPSGLDFMFPIGSPPNAIAFASGYIKLSEFIKKGILLNILTIVIFALSALFYWPLLGIN